MLVYKYRGVINDPSNLDKDKIFQRDLKTLQNNQFWSSKIEDLNDPCEAITNTKKIKKFLSYVGRKVGMKSKEDFQLVNENADNVLSLNDKMGIYSLSKTYLDELLWAHYANSHKGFCIEYDLEILLKNDGNNNIHSYPVKYSIHPPSVGYMDVILNRKDEMIQKFAFYKSKRWNYEKEHRIVTAKIGLNSYDYRALKGIYFGLKMDNSKKLDIMNCLKGRGINYYQIILEKNSYNFTFKKVEDVNNSKQNYLNEISIPNIKDQISFEIIKSKIFNNAGIGEIEVLIQRSLKTNELKVLAEHLKLNILNDAKTIFINFHLGTYEENTLPYASANFQKGKFQIEVIKKN